jgi:hypothetical protein
MKISESGGQNAKPKKRRDRTKYYHSGREMRPLFALKGAFYYAEFEKENQYGVSCHAGGTGYGSKTYGADRNHKPPSLSVENGD